MANTPKFIFAFKFFGSFSTTSRNIIIPCIGAPMPFTMVMPKPVLASKLVESIVIALVKDVFAFCNSVDRTKLSTELSKAFRKRVPAANQFDKAGSLLAITSKYIALGVGCSTSSHFWANCLACVICSVPEAFL